MTSRRNSYKAFEAKRVYLDDCAYCAYKERRKMSKIMVADDDPAIIDSLQLMFEEEGYDVETTVNGKTARDMKEELPDLLLLDVWMAGMDGRDICKHLKAQKTTRHIPIIMFSANVDIYDSVKAAGADEFIAKPFQMKKLLKLVDQYVNE